VSNNKLRLSIIIPVFNEEKYISQIYKRVRNAKLNYDIKKEIIIVDDGSTDNTNQIIQSIILDESKLITHKTEVDPIVWTVFSDFKL
jgi:glycosyltransferase involved in cell wall biosynthesis